MEDLNTMVESPQSQNDECISQMRKRVIMEMETEGTDHQHGLTYEKNDDIDQNIQLIRAIIATNGEILNRVIGSMQYDSDHGSAFKRFGFEILKVQHVHSKIQFITYPESSEMIFDLRPLKIFPTSLMLQPIYKTDFVSLIDYELFFERSLGALHQDVLVPFLVKLKDHLETIQVCLGEVEDWLLDSQSNMEFLEATFGVKLEKGGEDAEVYMSNNSSAFVDGTDRCLANEACVHCNSLFNWHQCVFMNGYYYRRCLNPPNTTTNGDGLRRFYSYPRHQLLKECEFGGRVEAVFDISQASEQDRLIKLLDFISC